MPETAITLQIVGAGEDYPRLITAYRSIKGTQVAYALRPTTGEGANALVHKDGGSFLHRFADADFPVAPTAPEPPDRLLTVLKNTKNGLTKAGPITLKGQWRGKLHVDVESKLWRVELVRKIASYGTIILISQHNGWFWRIERAAKWFVPTHTGHPTRNVVPEKRLLNAIRDAYRAALDLVGQACGMRDTQRRQAHDADYATRYPVRPPADRVVNLDRFKLPKPPKGKTPRKKAGSCDTCATDVPPADKAHGTPPRDVPVTTNTTALEKQTEALKADAEALTNTPVPAQPMSVDAVLSFFNGTLGFQHIFDRIHDYANGQLEPLDRAVPLSEFIEELRGDVVLQARKMSAEVQAEADAALVALEHALAAAPVQLKRAHSLIQYARAAVDSPRCTGPEEADARQAIDRATASYEEARAALVKGGEKAAIKAIRQSAAWLALSASKVAASCKSGQKSLLGHTPAKATAPAWETVLHDDDMPAAEEITSPSAALKTWLKGRGHAVDESTYLGLTTEHWQGHPTGSLLVYPADGDSFSIGPAPDVSLHDATKKAPAKAAPGAGTELVARSKYLGDPSASTAKGWVKIVLAQHGLEARKLSAKSWKGHDGGAYVKVTIVPSAAVSDDTIKSIEQNAPKGLSIEFDDVMDAPKKAKAPRIPRGRKAAPKEAHQPMSATDAALMAAFQQAIAAAVAGT
jgi:hypothetical protein